MPKEPKNKKSADATAPVPDMQQVKKDLVARARKAGHIDQRDINAAIADTPENADLLDRLYTELADAGLEITVGTAPGTDDEDVTPDDKTLSDDWALEEGEEAAAEDQHYLDDIADDSVRLYLREIGKIPLLSAEEEFELAQRIKRGDAAAKELAAIDAEENETSLAEEGKA